LFLHLSNIVYFIQDPQPYFWGDLPLYILASFPKFFGCDIVAVSKLAQNMYQQTHPFYTEISTTTSQVRLKHEGLTRLSKVIGLFVGDP
jgi:hypothetical protein